MKIFRVTYRKFLTATDHIDYHPSQIQSKITRTKRSVTYEIYGRYHSPTKTLTPSEESFLTAFMEVSHLLFIIKSKACWLMKSLVLDSTILRERHKSALESLYWSHCFVFHGNSSTARLKTLITTNSLITITIGRISQCTIATIRQVTVLHYFSYLLVKG